MRKNLNSGSKKNSNQRGVAVIFTLGILGLLTVMALGFASTALLNNSLSKNVMNNAYARSLAKNLALTQAMYIIDQKEIDGGFVDYRNIYTWGTDANSANHKDFLWKLDYSAAQYQNDPGVQIFKYEPDQNTSDKPRYNPANNVRWQYVKDSNNKLIGRYAYVVIPDKGRIDPSVNIGQMASKASEAPAAQPPLFSSASTEDDLKKQQTFVSPVVGSNKCYTAFNHFRWMTFRELIRKAEISNAFYMFQYNGVTPSLTMKSPEAFLKTDGKLYSRFNMNRDWSSMTPKDLCGVGKTLAEFPAEQQFIPWLKDMYDNSSTRTQALQIAANILQYNRPNPNALDTEGNPYPTVSDQSGDWLENPPTYAGIGRHPMLNEIGISIRVKAAVAANKVSAPGDPEKWEYTPSYTITIENGVELINPFSLTPSSKCHVKFSNAQEISIMLRSFKEDLSAVTISSDDDLKKLFYEKEWSWPILGYIIKAVNLKITGETATNKIVQIPQGLLSNQEPSDIGDPGNIDNGWTNFDFSREFTTDDWSSSVAYTKAEKFWKEQKRTVTFNKFTLDGTDRSAKIKQLMKLYQARVKLGNTVLRYTSDAIANQRDFAKLSDISEFKFSHISFPELFTDSNCGKEISAKAWLGQCAVEAKDPLVNHYPSDWVVKDKYDGDCDDSTPSGIKEINKNYPGSVFDSDGDPDEDKHHKNADVANDPACIKTTDEGGTTYTRLETAFIRHDQMCSFWELGCISRGEAWKTLNLLKKDNATPDFSYSRGDAVLFDQLKFTDENYSSGLINLNTDVHQVLEKLFNSGLVNYKKELGTLKSSLTDDLLQAGSDPSEGETPVKITAQTLDSSGNPDGPHSDCLACSLISATKAYNLKNRGDLLSEKSVLPTVTGETKPSDTDWPALQTLLQGGSSSYLEQVQIVSKLMPLLRTAPVDTLRVVILAQSIRDIGGDIPVLVDWDGKGFDTAITDATKPKAMYKAGYRRTIDGNAISGLGGEPSTTGTDSAGSKLLLKTYTKNAIGTYDLGRDKITGETRLVATLVRDPEKKKWKLVRLQYVE